MSSFEKIIGYSAVIEMLKQISDSMKNPEVYEKVGARFPKGVIFYGAPGLGKTLMANCLVEDLGLPSFTLRKTESTAEFVKAIKDVFEKAKEVAPSVILLDDMDKFANEDESREDCDEYVALQAAIDDVRACNVFIVATVNKMWKLPESLTRKGRFDKKICIDSPTREDAQKIMKHYLETKPLSTEINLDDFFKTMTFDSCAELEAVINDAALRAAYKRKNAIEMTELLEAVMEKGYFGSSHEDITSEDELRQIAVHEAGHIVLSEFLVPGSVGFSCIDKDSSMDRGGFIKICKPTDDVMDKVFVSVAGKAAVDLLYGDEEATGVMDDIRKAVDVLRDEILKECKYGIQYCNACDTVFDDLPDAMEVEIQEMVHSELEDCLEETKAFLDINREWLEACAEGLMQKGYLLFSDIQQIKEKFMVKPKSEESIEDKNHKEEFSAEQKRKDHCRIEQNQEELADTQENQLTG